METDILNTLVTEAIWRAEELEALGIRPASSAWKEVSKIEEQLAKAFPVSEAQGRIARRGAVDAALKAGDYHRARGLVEIYVAEDSAPLSLKTALREILEEADQTMKERLPYAAEHLSEVRELAFRLSANGPFGLAA